MLEANQADWTMMAWFAQEGLCQRGELSLGDEQKPEWKLKSATCDNSPKNTCEDAPQLPLAYFEFIVHVSTFQNEPLFPN